MLFEKFSVGVGKSSAGQTPRKESPNKNDKELRTIQPERVNPELTRATRSDRAGTGGCAKATRQETRGQSGNGRKESEWPENTKFSLTHTKEKMTARIRPVRNSCCSSKHA